MAQMPQLAWATSVEDTQQIREGAAEQKQLGQEAESRAEHQGEWGERRGKMFQRTDENVSTDVLPSLMCYKMLESQTETGVRKEVPNL